MNDPSLKKITLCVFATFRKIRKSEEELQFPVEADIEFILNSVSIPVEEVAIILINGKHSELKTKPTDGDRVSIFPAVGGG